MAKDYIGVCRFWALPILCTPLHFNGSHCGSLFWGISVTTVTVLHSSCEEPHLPLMTGISESDKEEFWMRGNLDSLCSLTLGSMDCFLTSFKARDSSFMKISCWSMFCTSLVVGDFMVVSVLQKTSSTTVAVTELFGVFLSSKILCALVEASSSCCFKFGIHRIWSEREERSIVADSSVLRQG